MIPPNSKTYHNLPANPAHSPEQNPIISFFQNHPNTTVEYIHFKNEKSHYCRFYSNSGERKSGVSAGVEGFNYRYHFNNKEADNEVIGEGNSYDFGARIYDTRVGKFLSLDPLFAHFPYISNYCFASNSPIAFIDYNGLFRMSRRMQRKYPQLTNVLKNIQTTVHNDPRTLEAFKKELDLTDAEVDAILSWNHGPKVIVGFTKIVGIFKPSDGFFWDVLGFPNADRGLIGLSRQTINKLEEYQSFQTNYDQPCFAVYKLLLHERQHKAEDFRPKREQHNDHEYWTNKFEKHAWSGYSEIGKN